MKKIQTEIIIDSDVSRVWKVLTDFENHAKWNPFIKSIKGEQKAGKSLVVNLKPPDGKGMTFKPVILKFEPNKEFRWKGKLGIKGIFEGEHYFVLEEHNNGKTKFIHGENFSGVLVPLMGKILNNTKKGFMHLKVTILFLIFVIFLSCNSDSYHSKSFPNNETVSHQMDSVMSGSDIPGLVAIAINEKGERIEYTFGNAIWDEVSPVKTNHIFRIASMTKLITSLAALQLVERDSIELDDDLSYRMPEMDSIPIMTDNNELVRSENGITLRELLTHTSGFGYTFTDSLLSKHDQTDWKYEDLPRRFESGTQFLYGRSTDWTGKLIEKISGLSLEEYFRKNITGPLGMDRTWFNIVSFGRRGEDGTKELAEIPNRIPKNKTQNYGGGGGLFSSPDDYTKLLTCLLNDGKFSNGRILLKETIDQIFIEQFEDISMDIKENYFNPGVCCNFSELIKPSAGLSLAGIIDSELTSYGRKDGTLFWGGVLNTYWYIDRKSGISATIFTQHLPFNHPATTSVFEKFSEIIYENYN
jgi:CubicO group peptidase (beta-lactamase class C family)